MKRFMALLIAAIMLAATSASIWADSDPADTLPAEDETTAADTEPTQDEPAAPAEDDFDDEELSTAAAANKVEYTDDNIIGGSIYYDPASGTIVDCDSNVISCVVPSEIDGVKITAIGPKAFEKTDLIRITIPDSVTVISDYAFSNSKLNAISLPASVISIGSYAFSQTPIKSATILGNAVLSNSVFLRCEQLETVSIPSITELGASAFYNCSALYDIHLPNGITSIPESAFQGCEALAYIEIPLSVKKIGKSAFNSADLSGDFVIPNSVTSIGESAFAYTKLQGHLVIPNSVTELGISAFSGSSFGEVTIPGSIKNIPDRAFQGCSALAKINIGEGVVSIGKSAFYTVAGWKVEPCKVSVYLPSTLEYILDSAFFYGSTGVSTGGMYTIPKRENITDLYYGGCATKWQMVLIGSENDSIGNAALHTADHDYQYTYDDNSHWLACEYCGTVSGEKSAHEMKGDVCAVCGYGAPEEHVHSYVYKSDVNVHWQYCEACGDTCNVEEHTFENGTCKYCGSAKAAAGGLNGDMDNDGKITLNDAVLVLKIAMNVA